MGGKTIISEKGGKGLSPHHRDPREKKKSVLHTHARAHTCKGLHRAADLENTV